MATTRSWKGHQTCGNCDKSNPDHTEEYCPNETKCPKPSCFLVILWHISKRERKISEAKYKQNVLFWGYKDCRVLHWKEHLSCIVWRVNAIKWTNTELSLRNQSSWNQMIGQSYRSRWKPSLHWNSSNRSTNWINRTHNKEIQWNNKRKNINKIYHSNDSSQKIHSPTKQRLYRSPIFPLKTIKESLKNLSPKKARTNQTKARSSNWAKPISTPKWTMKNQKTYSNSLHPNSIETHQHKE